MNRFMPLRHDAFKRFVFKLKKKLGLRHVPTLETVAKACGFRGLHEVSAIHREGAPRPVPTALQCAGDTGYDIWLAQLDTAIGTDVRAVMGSAELRQLYRLVFEPCVSDTHLPPIQQEALSEAGEVLSGDELRVPKSAPPVVVTYRRRGQLPAEYCN